jgi:hypothetical protein
MDIPFSADLEEVDASALAVGAVGAVHEGLIYIWVHRN